MISLNDILNNTRYGATLCPTSTYNDEPFLIIDDVREFNKGALLAKQLSPTDIFEFEEDEDPEDRLTLEKLENLDKSTLILDHYDWGYWDQYTQCGDCGKAVDTQSYSPEGQAFCNIGEYFCEECIRNNHVEEYIDLCANNPNMANVLLRPEDLNKYGYTKYEEEPEHSGGLYSHNDNEDPKHILDKLQDKFDVIFNVTCQTPFEVEWDTWTKLKE